MRGYLNKQQIELLENLVGGLLENIIYHYWSDGKQNLLDWIELHFNHARVIIGVGDIAEDITVTDFDKNKIENELGITVKSVGMTHDPTWQRCIGHQLVNYKLTDKKGYCHSSVVFSFKDMGVEIFANDDSLMVRINHNAPIE